MCYVIKYLTSVSHPHWPRSMAIHYAHAQTHARVCVREAHTNAHACVYVREAHTHTRDAHAHTCVCA